MIVYIDAVYNLTSVTPPGEADGLSDELCGVQPGTGLQSGLGGRDGTLQLSGTGRVQRSC